MNTIIWFEVYCAGCNKRNYVDGGDPTDMTGEDFGGFVCWSCKLSTRVEKDGTLVLCKGEEEDEGFDDGIEILV